MTRHTTPKSSRVRHEIFASAASHFPDAVNDIYRGRIDSLLIKQVFDKKTMVQVRHKLKEKQAFMVDADYGYTFGAALIDNHGKRSEFSAINAFRQHLADVFGEDNVETRIELLLKKMSGNRQVMLFNEGKDKHYAPATFRFIQPGHCLLIHRGNEYIEHEVFSELSKTVNLQHHLSYFIVIDPPDQGGELYLYDLPDDQLPLPQDQLDFNHCNVHIITPEAGDMVLFHGGCLYHKINEISGTKQRISLGGFVGVGKEDNTVYYWS